MPSCLRWSAKSICRKASCIRSSVIIPVRNRIRTIADAIESVLKQETDFPFNLIVIDNHSTTVPRSALTNTPETKK